MKLESLTVIFLVIIIPISIVLSEYVNTRIKTEKLEIEYNTKLLNATYDAIKSFQLNTVNNNTGDDANSKINDLEGAANTFYTSLATNFNYTGYKSEVMEEYVPAIAFTLYDGYYIYTPFTNILTEVDSYDTTFSKDKEKGVGLKTYVYYSCRYKRGALDDFIITYSLDNYITIQGNINGKYIVDYGYLYKIAESRSDEGIYWDVSSNSYYYDNVEFTPSDTEEMKEYVGETEYSYTKINGVKYYLDNDYNGYTDGRTDKRAIFAINKDGTKNYSITKGYSENNRAIDNETFNKYFNAITKNKSAYQYYKNAYEFSKAVLTSTQLTYDYWDKSNADKDPSSKIATGYGLGNLKVEDVYITQASSETINIKENEDMEIFGGTVPIQKENSNFNKHRKNIIRYVVETNLVAAISNYSSNNGEEYIMPKISDEDWELVQNEPCAISFMHGMNIGSKIFNSYKVVQNKLSKEHIDEDDIYILTNNNTYVRVTDNSLINAADSVTPKSKAELGYYSGIWKLNFEKKIDKSSGTTEISYVPMSYGVGGYVQGYIGSYTSIMGNSKINFAEIENSDMYTYVHNKFNNDLKKIYYTALGRERHGSFHVNNINYETYESNSPEKYFLTEQSESEPESNSTEQSEGLQTGGTEQSGAGSGTTASLESKVGYYADLNGDGQITVEEDGIIFADLAVGASGSIYVANSDSGRIQYLLKEVTNGLKTYEESTENVTGDVAKFGEQKWIKAQSGTTGKNRFYVMALKDIDTNKHYWYKNAYEYNQITRITSYQMGIDENNKAVGRTNTENIMAVYNKETNDGGWGLKAEGQKYTDMFDVIKTKYDSSVGWFVPSAREWACFSGAVINGKYVKRRYKELGLSDYYWSSSQDSSKFNSAWCINYYLRRARNRQIKFLSLCSLVYDFLIS